MTEIRAITVKQPWAFAITHLGKTVENRGTSFAYRGRILIHAGREWDGFAVDDRRIRAGFAPYLTTYQQARYINQIDPAEHHDRFVFGAVIGVAELVDVHRAKATVGCCEPWGDQWYASNSGVGTAHHLVLDNVLALDMPVACRGNLGMWRPPAEVVAAVDAQVAEAGR